MNKKLLSLAAVHRLRAAMVARRFALGVVTGLVLAASLLTTFTAWSTPAHSDVGRFITRFITGGEQVDTMVITDHLFLNGPGGQFEISIGKDPSGKDVVTATPSG